MVQFFNEYQEIISIGKLPVSKLENQSILQQSVAKLENEIIPILLVIELEITSIRQLSVSQLETDNQQLIAKIGWEHHIILIQKIKDLSIRYWYMQQITTNLWFYLKNNNSLNINNPNKTLY